MRKYSNEWKIAFEEENVGFRIFHRMGFGYPNTLRSKAMKRMCKASSPITLLLFVCE